MKFAESVYKDWKCVKSLSDSTYFCANDKEEFTIIRLLNIPADQSQVFDLLAQGYNMQSAEDYYTKKAHALGDEIQRFAYLEHPQGINRIEQYELRKQPGHYGWQMVIVKPAMLPLTQWLTYDAMDLDKAMEMCADLLTGLETCLKAGSSHGHIVPENVGLAKGGRFILDDVVYSSSGHQALHHADSYFQAPKDFTEIQADLYALAMLVIWCLAQSGMDEGQIDTLLYESKYASILEKALSAEPEDRYADPWQMHRELEAVLHHKK